MKIAPFMTGKLKILFVEDIIMDAELNWRELEKNGIEFKTLLVDNKKDYLEGLKSFIPDLIISDYSLPQFDGMQALSLRNELAPHIPFIIVTGAINEEVAVECMKAGADDYVIKEHLTRLPFAVKEALEQSIVKIEKKAADLLLKENEEKLQSIFSATPVGIGLVVDRIFMEVNDTFCKMTGYTRKELIGKSSDIIYATKEEYESAGNEKYSQISEKGLGTVETRFKCKNGNILNIQLSSAPLDQNNLKKGVTFTAMDITERVKAEDALKESNHLLQTLSLVSPVGIFRTNPDGNTTYYNPKYSELTGLSAEEGLGFGWLNAVHPDDREKLSDTWFNNLKSKIESGGEFRYLKPDGSVSWVIGKAVPEMIGNEIAGYIGTITDITDRKNAEEIIIQERKILRTLIDNLPDLIYVIDSDYRKIISNLADVRNFGLKSEKEALGKTDIELFPGEIGVRGHEDNKEVISSGKPLIEREEDFVDAMGVRRWFLTTKIPLHDKNGKIIGLVGIGHDITERKRAETELLHSYEFSKSLLKTIPFGMDIVDETGTILFHSENFKGLFGDKAIGRKCWEIYRDDKKQCSDCPLFKGITIGETETYEAHGLLDNRIFEIIHTGMLYQGKKAMLEIFQDITQKKIIEKELYKAKEKAEESDRLKTSFLHNISHEIRTPMNAILGFSVFLGDPDLLPEKRKFYNDIIQQSCEQLLLIISDIVSMATIEAGMEKINEKEINLNSVLTLIYEQFVVKAKVKNISLNMMTMLSDHEIKIVSEETKLMQILSNLLSNALKFTISGSVNFGYTIKGSMIEFFVQDTGIGIAPEMYDVIFERFRQVETEATRQFGGSGLGLAISKSYVELLGGKIWLKSVPGEGTTFFFTIPYKKADANSLPEFKSINNIKIDDSLIRTLLIAEDEETNFMLLEELLNVKNFNIIRAINGLEAVKICESDKQIDMVLMDIKMPVMDGYEATSQIKKIRPGLPIIAQTAYSSEKDKTKAIESGCDDFISKPINKTLLLSKIYQQLSGNEK